MKAATIGQYGPPEVLKVKEIEKPAPKEGEMLVKVFATDVNVGDARLRKADPFAVRFFFGLFRPGKKVLGGMLSGEVAALGPGTHRFKVGDSVFGATQLRLGAYAEYICLPSEGALALKPDALSHAEAASVPFGGITAYHFLQKANVRRGQKVLIYGASGAVGSAAVQIAKYYGAEVTAMCSEQNAEWVKSLGADRVLDYARTPVDQTGEQYDVVYETVNKVPVSSCASAVKKGGTLILGAALLKEMIQGMWAVRQRDKKLLVGVAYETREAVAFLRERLLEGRFKPVLGRTYPFEQIVEAHRYVDGGHKRGNVVLELG